MLFNRNLLYTGVTRAKTCVTILGSSKTLQEMIDNNYQNRRYTGLTECIESIFIK
jgi:exodeoxyribonuclease V alpha subunit